MTEQDRPEFAGLMVAIGEVYGESISEARMELYFRALEDLPIDAVRAAAESHVRHQKFFPRPAEIREIAEGNVDDAAEIAWGKVQRLVRSVGYTGTPIWPDEPTRRAALELYGGWVPLCASLPADGPELLGYRKQFIATFKAYAAQDKRDQATLPTGSAADQLQTMRANVAVARNIMKARS